MDKEHKRKGKAPAHRRKQENNRITPQSTESVEDKRPQKRKRAAEDETPRKRIRVSEMAGPSTISQDQIRMAKKMKMKATEEGEGHSPPAMRKKKGLLDQVLTNEPPSAVDISIESSSSSPAPDCTGTGDLQKNNLKRKRKDFKETQPRKKTKRMMEKERVATEKAAFLEKYIELHQLGEGGFGYVFAGYRVEDKLPVAIKHIPKNNVVLKHTEEDGRELAMEVAIMLKLHNGASSMGHSAFVSLLDWYDLDRDLVVVMERPMPSDDLSDYLDNHRGCLKDREAKIILKQLVEAAVQLQNSNIFHRDIKVENILIQTSSEGPRVYLIDFGLSCFDDKKTHELFCGTPGHIPLDWYINTNYTAGPTTVWQLGVVLFELVHKDQFQTASFIANKLKISKRLSKYCQDFLRKCLMVDPMERPTLEELLSHPWFS